MAPGAEQFEVAEFIAATVAEDGTPAGDYTAAVPNWKPGDTIPLGPGKSLRVVDIKPHPTLSGVLVVTLAGR